MVTGVGLLYRFSLKDSPRGWLGVVTPGAIVATVGWLIVLYRKRHPLFHRYRRAALAGVLGAQPLFLFFPVSPPRKLDHLVDTMAEVSNVDLDSGLIEKLYHPLAAMPSIHVTIAEVTASGIRETARSPVLRALAPMYPPLVAAVVLLTANHYVVDVLVGRTLGRAALRAARLLERPRSTLLR